MTTVKVKDATGQIKYFEVVGSGTEQNPFRQIYEVIFPSSMPANVSNFPATQTIAGTVEIASLSATQAIPGTINVNNFPNTQVISAASLPLPTGAATVTNQITGNTSLSSIDTKLPAGLTVANNRLQVDANISNLEISNDVGNPIPVSLPASTRTPRLLTTNTTGTIAAGSKSVAIANIGSSNGTIAGAILPPGVSVSWEAQLKDTINAITYDANNTTFLISTLT